MDANNLNRRILALALPAIVSNITVPLLGLCDTAIAGHLGDARYIGAIAIGTMMLNVIFWLSGFLRMGTTGLTAGAFGASDSGRIIDIIFKSLIIALLIGVIVIAVRTPLYNLLERIVGADSDITALTSVYFRICIWGAPAQLVIMAVSGWYIGLQNTIIPMAIAIGTNIINIAASLLSVFALKTGFPGIAVGTLAANWAGATASLIIAAARIRKEKRKAEGISETVAWSDLFKVNGTLFVRSACIMSVTFAVTATGARLGNVTLAANAVMMQFFVFFSYFMDGFAFSGEALVGRYSGAGDTRNLKNVIRSLLWWGAAMAIIFFTLYYFFSAPITGLLTDRPDVVAEVESYRLFIYLLPPVTVATFIYDGIYIGLTRTKAMMFSTLAGALLFFAIVCRPGAVGNSGLLTAFLLYLLVRGLILASLLRFFIRKSGNLHGNS